MNDNNHPDLRTNEPAAGQRPVPPPPPNSGQQPVPPPFRAAYPPPVPRVLTAEYQTVLAASSKKRTKILAPILLLFCIWLVESIVLSGVGFVSLITLGVFYGILFWYYGDRSVSVPAVILCVPALLIAAANSLYYNPSTRFFTAVAAGAVVATQILLLSGASKATLFSFEMLRDAGRRLVGTPIADLDIPFRGAFSSPKGKSTRTGLFIFLGLVISVPLALILFSLFAGADEAYARGMRTLFYEILRLSPNKLVVDLIFGVLLACGLFAVLVTCKAEIPFIRRPKEHKGWLPSALVITVTAVLLLVTLSFVAVQFNYLFLGSRGFLPQDMNYSEYARRGFFEMSWASGFIFLIVALALGLVGRENAKVSPVVRLLLVFLCLGDGVILASAVKRMLLYVEVNGLSVKRILTLWFMVIVAACLIFLMVKCIAPRFKAMPFMMGSILVCCVALSFVNLDGWIAQYNVNGFLSGRLTQTSDFLDHLGTLSYSATPATAKLIGSELDTAETHEKIMLQLKRQRDTYEKRDTVYAFTFDQPEAKRIYDQYKTELDSVREYFYLDDYDDDYSSNDSYIDEYAVPMRNHG